MPYSIWSASSECISQNTQLASAWSIFWNETSLRTQQCNKAEPILSTPFLPPTFGSGELPLSPLDQLCHTMSLHKKNQPKTLMQLSSKSILCLYTDLESRYCAFSQEQRERRDGEWWTGSLFHSSKLSDQLHRNTRTDPWGLVKF